MAFAKGTKVGVYEVVEVLGRGGMGEVYRAHDTKLHRDIALKVLPDSFATDADRLARFEREAQVLASLNHPHIAAIYGLDETGPTKALVLELVEGPTLADRIAQGPLPLDEVRSIARQIAQALEAAHERGIVHRDLKPANIKVRGDGTVKVLDFGLAKALESPGTRADLSQSPTITSPALTQMGVLLGTAPYMSPELAKGHLADKRCDIWAFGCVLYEMLSGRRAFDGEHMTEVLGAVVRLEPDWTALPPTVPPALPSLLKRCLQKDPALRMRDIADARFQVEEAFDVSPMPVRSDGPSRPGRERAGWMAAALMAAVAATALVVSLRAPEDPAETWLEIVTPPAAEPTSLAMSPDGRSVVFQAEQKPPRLWLRPLASQEARPLTGTEGATSPFWSPDSRSVGFFADGLMKRLDLDTGFVRTLAPVPVPRGGTWHRNGTILIGNGLGPLNTVTASGGPVTAATRLLPEQTDQRWPHFLPDGDRFLLFATGAPDARGLFVGSLRDNTLRRVMDRELAYAFMPPSYVLLARQGALWARKLNVEYTSAEGEFVPVAPKVLIHPALVGLGAVSTSTTGSIAFRASPRTTQLVWFDRSGSRVSSVGQADDSQMSLHQLSSDGRAAVIERNVGGNRDVWVIDLERGIPRRLTSDEGDDGVPIFSPDGRRVVHATGGRREFFDLRERRSDGTGGSTLLLPPADEYKQPQDWSADGRYILYRVQTVEKTDLWALPLFGRQEPFEITRTPFEEGSGRFSPDGRWVAYQSTETGRNEIWIQPFPGPGPKLQISVDGGALPRWRRDGRELFYAGADGYLKTISLEVNGASLTASPARPLFQIPAIFGAYEPSADGRQFLVNAIVSEASPITIILNWKAPGS